MPTTRQNRKKNCLPNFCWELRAGRFGCDVKETWEFAQQANNNVNFEEAENVK